MPTTTVTLAPAQQDAVEWLIHGGADDTTRRLADMTGTLDDIRVLQAAIAEESASPSPRSSRLNPMEAKLRKFSAAATANTVAMILSRKSGGAAQAAEVTSALPKDPRWDQAREISDGLRLCGRMFLRGQVKLGMLLAALKKELGYHRGCTGRNRSADSADLLPWPELVKREIGYSRKSCDEFIRLYEATKAKLKKAKKLALPADVKKDAIILFRAENPLALSDDQWRDVDALIGTLTTGETQASLMEELGIIPAPRPMPKGGVPKPRDPSITAGQLAFHFFDAVAAPLVSARTNPDYKKLLRALPVESSEDHPLSLCFLEAEARAWLADIEEARAASSKPARGRVSK